MACVLFKLEPNTFLDVVFQRFWFRPEPDTFLCAVFQRVRVCETVPFFASQQEVLKLI